MRLAAPLVCALALAACGSERDIVRGGTVIGSQLTVYVLTPDPGAGKGRALVDGAKLALADVGGRAGRYTVNFGALDTGRRGGSAAGAARKAISDGQTIAVVADATPVTVPLFNEAGLLQVALGGDLALGHEPRLVPSGRRTLTAPRPGDAPPAGFAGRFRATFGRPADAAAAHGYRAMRGIVAAIASAGPRGDERQAVLDAYLAPRHAG